MSFFTRWNNKIILLFIFVILASGCEGVKKKIPDADSQFDQQINPRFSQEDENKVTTDDTALTPTDRQGIKEEDIKITEEAAETEVTAVPKEVFTLKDIHFQFDKSDLDGDSRAYLETMAAWLDENRSLKVSIEGHADDRGTSEYNLALGARRADAVKRYLEILGVSTSRLSTISYGEEMPVQEGQNEAAWAANRRVHFEGI